MKAFWQDTDSAERRAPSAERQEVIAGSGENAKQLRPTYASEADALAAAQAEWRRIQRGLADFDLTLAYGRADMRPESPLQVRGFKPEIDATPWLVAEVAHSLNDNGFGTQIRCEISGAGGN